MNGTNDGPTAVVDSGTTDQNTAATFNVTANDTDPDTSDALAITSATLNSGSGLVTVVGDQVFV